MYADRIILLYMHTKTGGNCYMLNYKKNTKLTILVLYIE